MRKFNSIDNRKALTTKTEFAGRKWFYSYRQVPSFFQDQVCERAAQKMLVRYSKITQKWNDVENSIWICRLFMATKLIMMATLQINSLEYAEGVNLRAAAPHLRYYALLSLARALCLTLPELNWDGGNLLTMTHKRALQCTVEHLQIFDKDIAKRVDTAIRMAKAQRELIDYRAPTSGDSDLSRIGQLKDICRLLAELAQMNSELLEISFDKHTGDTPFQVLEEEAWKILQVEIDGHTFMDDDDIRRVSYLSRKHPRPSSLTMLMTEGHVEDFFGAWCDEGAGNDCFDPDSNWRAIFDIL